MAYWERKKIGGKKYWYLRQTVTDPKTGKTRHKNIGYGGKTKSLKKKYKRLSSR